MKKYREFHNQFDDPVDGEAENATAAPETPQGDGAALANGQES